MPGAVPRLFCATGTCTCYAEYWNVCMRGMKLKTLQWLPEKAVYAVNDNYVVSTSFKFQHRSLYLLNSTHNELSRSWCLKWRSRNSVRQRPARDATTMTRDMTMYYVMSANSYISSCTSSTTTHSQLTHAWGAIKRSEKYKESVH